MSLYYDSKYQTTQTDEYKRILDSMTNAFYRYNEREMNMKNFNYITQDLLKVYRTIIVELPIYALTYNKAIGDSIFNTFDNRINFVKSNKEYINAYITISYLTNSIFNFIDYDKRIVLRNDEYKKLFDFTLNDFENIINYSNMTLENYNFIYTDVLYVLDKMLNFDEGFWRNFANNNKGVANKIFNYVKSSYNFIFGDKNIKVIEENVFEREDLQIFLTDREKNIKSDRLSELKNILDEKRHDYLTTFVENIENTTDKTQKRLMIKDIYHYSPLVLKKRNIFVRFIPDYGTITYKEYWDNVRTKLENNNDK